MRLSVDEITRSSTIRHEIWVRRAEDYGFHWGLKPREGRRRRWWRGRKGFGMADLMKGNVRVLMKGWAWEFGMQTCGGESSDRFGRFHVSKPETDIRPIWIGSGPVFGYRAVSLVLPELCSPLVSILGRRIYLGLVFYNLRNFFLIPAEACGLKLAKTIAAYRKVDCVLPNYFHESYSFQSFQFLLLLLSLCGYCAFLRSVV